MYISHRKGILKGFFLCQLMILLFQGFIRNVLLILEQVYKMTCLYVRHTERKDFSHSQSTNTPNLNLVSLLLVLPV